MHASRIRRQPDEAKRLILTGAEQLLRQGGPLAVQVRAVAQRVNMTDAGITHHFGNRDGLLVALLQHGGRRIRDAVQQATRTWMDGGASLTELVDRVADVYQDGYGELAVALHSAGWRDNEGTGLLDPVVDALHAARADSRGQRPSKTETRLAVAALHQALATEPVYGDAFRRSAGLKPATNRARQQRNWWINTLAAVLDID